MLIGLATGMLSDGELSDEEIKFLDDWLTNHDAISHEWPGSVIHNRIRVALEDGVITNDERSYLVETLQLLIGGNAEKLFDESHATDLCLDEDIKITFADSAFCFTGDFVFGPRSACAQFTSNKGGRIIKGITKKLDYLIIGSLGSQEWKHGSFGTKIEKAMNYKSQGVPINILGEDCWANQL